MEKCRAKMATINLLNLTIMMMLISNSQSKPNIIKSLPGYPGNLPFKLETGYVGVGEREEVQLFYYFIESERNPTTDPLLVWFNGGPGCSAFSGLAFEIGPLYFNSRTSNFMSGIPQIQPNPYSWTKVANIIFLDSPVGTGFSYATTSRGYYCNDTLQSLHIYEFLRKWLREHSGFITTPLYITGDSYVGKVVPLVVQDILMGNSWGIKPKLNVKGYVIGNPSTDLHFETNSRVKYEHRISLLSDELYKFAKRSCNGEYMYVNTNNTKCLKILEEVNDITQDVYPSCVLEPKCLNTTVKAIKRLSTHNYQKDIGTSFHLRRRVTTQWCRFDDYDLSEIWANDERVREALNIRQGTIDRWIRCNRSIPYIQNVQSSFGYHQNLSKEVISALIYSGDQDMDVSYVGTHGWINELGLFIVDNWKPWFVESQVAGFVTEYSKNSYHLTYTTIKGGGHTAAEYKRRECLAMIKTWLSLHHL